MDKGDEVVYLQLALLYYCVLVQQHQNTDRPSLQTSTEAAIKAINFYKCFDEEYYF
jgi:hypothetical protein